PRTTAMSPNVLYAASNSLRGCQCWPYHGSFSSTCDGVTPITVTACSRSEYDTAAPSHARHVASGSARYVFVTHVTAGWPLITAANTAAGPSPAPAALTPAPAPFAARAIGGASTPYPVWSTGLPFGSPTNAALGSPQRAMPPLASATGARLSTPVSAS